MHNVISIRSSLLLEDGICLRWRRNSKSTLYPPFVDIRRHLWTLLIIRTILMVDGSQPLDARYGRQMADSVGVVGRIGSLVPKNRNNIPPGRSGVAALTSDIVELWNDSQGSSWFQVQGGGSCTYTLYDPSMR